MNILKSQQFVFVDGRKQEASEAIPSIGAGTLGQSITEEASTLVGEVVFQKSPKDTEWRWWVGGGTLLFFAASWLASIILPFSFLEVVEVVVVSALCAAILITVAAAVAMLMIVALVSYIRRDTSSLGFSNEESP